MRLRSLAVAAAMSVALIGGMATPGQAATPSDPAPEQTLIAYTADRSVTVYAEGRLDTKPVLLVTDSAGRANKAAVVDAVKDCGIVTCSIYMSRAETRRAHRDIALYGGGIGGLAGACTLLALIPVAGVALAVVCGVGLPIYGAFFLNALDHAKSDNKCLRIRWNRVAGGGYTFYSDGSKFCRN